MPKTDWYGTKSPINRFASPHIHLASATFILPSSTPTKTRNQSSR
jgi:hypothetical protein